MSIKKKWIILMILLALLSQITCAGKINKAAKKENIAEIEAILQKEPALLNSKDKDGNTLLHHAASDGHEKIVEFLIEKGAAVDEKNNVEATPIYLATINGHLKIIQFLISKGANINVKSGSFEGTLLHAASFKGHFDVVDFFISRGFDVNEKDNVGCTSLHRAVEGLADIYVVKLLVSKGAQVNIKNKNGSTPLHWVAQSPIGKPEVAKFLIEKGAEINVRNEYRQTPVDLAEVPFPGGNKQVAWVLKSNGGVSGKADRPSSSPDKTMQLVDDIVKQQAEAHYFMGMNFLKNKVLWWNNRGIFLRARNQYEMLKSVP